MRKSMEGLSKPERCIGDLLRESSETGDWALFERAVVAAYLRPSIEYTTVLCEVLDRRDDTLNNQDIVEALEAIADPRSVDALVSAMHWESPFDEYHELGVKCVWALKAINTPEARQALRDAAEVAPVEIREMAKKSLSRLPEQPLP